MLENHNIPQNLNACLEDLLRRYQTLLADNLHGIVVHGSLAMGCYNPQSSDVDLLVSVHKPLNLIEKQQLGAIHLSLSDEHNLNIELSVLLQSYLTDFVYPTPFEFHYSDAHKQSFADGTVDLTTAHSDTDLAAHIMISKHYGIAYYGQSPQETYPNLPVADYLDSITIDAKWSYDNIIAGSDEGLCYVPTYAVLNFCRVLAFIKAKQITSKRSGGEWGMINLATTYQPIIREALNEYANSGSSQPIDCAMLKAFARYAFEIIQEHLD